MRIASVGTDFLPACRSELFLGLQAAEMAFDFSFWLVLAGHWDEGHRQQTLLGHITGFILLKQ